MRKNQSSEPIFSNSQSSAKNGANLAAARSAVIVLAAGMGKRMKSSLPKVLHSVGGEPILFHILSRIQEAAPQASVAIVVGHGRELVEKAVREESRFSALQIEFVLQPEQRGTGHAAQCAMGSAWGDRMIREKRPVLVLPGDSPLLTAELLAQMLKPLSSSEAMRLLTTELDEPAGYGRIVRRGKRGPVLKIVEEKDASIREKQIREVGTSIYLFAPAFLKAGLQKLSPKNAQGEYYLTDLVHQASRNRKRIDVLQWADSSDLRGVNDPWELAQAGKLLNERVVRRWALDGVRFIDPQTTYVESQVSFGSDCVVYPGAFLSGRTRIGSGVSVGPNVLLRDVEVGDHANLKAGTFAEASRIGAHSQIGPYAHLRPESVVGDACKIGNFVELKKSVIGEKTSIAHLSYVGDAEVGKRVNIGCGFVTCNYDGVNKHKTVIEDEVFVGSDSQIVAPARIGRGAYIASGSTITEDVEAEALALARSRQINKPGYARKLKKKS
jgi:bifunctional UDP-N-acetylglucosamine pyrophosphorylase/glucosamine-1-phosphate N-acetyltransferase